MKQVKTAPEVGAAVGGSGRSITVDIDTCDVFATVGEFKKHLCESGGTGLGEDV